MSADPRDNAIDVQNSLAEFADLNRRRLFGSPALDVDEMERWLELRGSLEAHFGKDGSSDWSHLDRREFLRLPTHIRVELGRGDDTQIVSARDVSQGGLFIATRRPLEKGSQVRLELKAEAGGELVEITGTVAWVSRESDGSRPPGMGVAFDDLDGRQRALIADLVTRAAG